MSTDLVRVALERAAVGVSEKPLGLKGQLPTVADVLMLVAAQIRAMAKDDEAVAAIIASVLGEPT